MNIKHLIVSTLILAAAGAAGAASADTGKTRAEVVAELKQARADGTLDFNEADYPRTIVQPASHLTRVQVKADVLAARAAGELDINDADYPATIPPVTPRATSTSTSTLQLAHKISSTSPAQ